MNRETLENHKVNPDCDCTICFVKDVMNETNCDYDEVIEILKGMQEKGYIEIKKWDNEGFPLEIIRTISKKKTKRLLSRLEAINEQSRNNQDLKSIKKQLQKL